MDVSANPSQPIFPSTDILITVNNRTGYPIGEATVYVTQQNGSILFQSVTNVSGQTEFTYLGDPVAVNIIHQDYQSKTIIVGVIPIIWYIAFWTLTVSFVAVLGVMSYAWVHKQRYQSRLIELEKSFQELQNKTLEVKELTEIRDQSMQILETISVEFSFSSDASQQFLQFLEINGIDDFLHFGLEFARSEVTENKSYNLSIALFSLTQAFEGIIMKLAESCDEIRIQSHMTMGMILRKLFPTEIFVKALKFYGGFDKNNESTDFTNKLQMLLENRLIMEGWQYRETLDQPHQDFTITLLTRNFTHHSTTLDVTLYTDVDIYERTEKHVVSAMLRAFIILNSVNAE